MGSPVSPIVVNLYMEDLEQKIISTTPTECKPKQWKWYVDDIIDAIKRGQAEKLQDHMNKADPTGSVQFTREDEIDMSMPFLDAFFTHCDDGSIKSKVYCKATHTDQYLNFASHHLQQQKVRVVL